MSSLQPSKSRIAGKYIHQQRSMNLLQRVLPSRKRDEDDILEDDDHILDDDEQNKILEDLENTANYSEWLFRVMLN